MLAKYKFLSNFSGKICKFDHQKGDERKAPVSNWLRRDEISKKTGQVFKKRADDFDRG